MAGSSFSIDTSAFEAGIKKAINNVQNMTPLSNKIGEALVVSTRQRFKDEKSPSGEKWDPSNRAVEQGGQTLSDTARLKNSIRYEATSDTVFVGTNVKYAAIHQFGSDGGSFKRPSGVIARPFLGISKEDLEEAKDIAAKHVQKGWQ